jgi:hypothetical protein
MTLGSGAAKGVNRFRRGVTACLIMLVIQHQPAVSALASGGLDQRVQVKAQSRMPDAKGIGRQILVQLLIAGMGELIKRFLKYGGQGPIDNVDFCLALDAYVQGNSKGRALTEEEKDLLNRCAAPTVTN